MMTECEACGFYDANAGYAETCTHCGARLPKANVWYECVVIVPKLSKETCIKRRDLATSIMDDLQSFLVAHPEYICDTFTALYHSLKQEAEVYDESANA